MTLRSRTAALLIALLAPAGALAAGSALSPVSVSVMGGESRSFIARFVNADGSPVARAPVTWANDVCGTFPNSASTATSTTDANGVTSIRFTAAPTADITCWLTASAGDATVQFDVLTYRLDQVSLAVVPGVNFDPQGTMTFTVSVQLGGEALPEVEITSQVLPGTAPAPVSFLPAVASTGQRARADFVLQPPARATGEYTVDFAFSGITRQVSVQRGAEYATLARTISAPAPDGGRRTLTISSAAAACGFSGSSAILDPAVTEFRREFAPSRGLVYTEGLFSIRAEYCYGPSPATFTLTTPRPVPAGSMFWMLSATKDKPLPHWHAVPVVVSGNSASFTLADGVSDGDLVADGVITAYGGLAVAPPWYFELQDLWWGGLGENGWGVSIVQHDEKLFAVIFAYDGNGMPTWYVMPGGQWNAGRTVFTGALYSPRGAPYTAYDPARLDVGPSVGTLMLTFTDATHATLDYVINGMVGRKQITRQQFGASLANTRPVVGDMWWGGERQSGWGIAILQQFGTLFATWFTYNEKGEPTWFVMPAGSWTATDTFEGRIYRTSSSRWLAMSYNTTSFRVNDVGSFRVRFLTTDTAVFEWTIDGRSGSLPLSRQTF
jgi:hypothetical protein